MISIKKYLEDANAGPYWDDGADERDLLSLALRAYRSSLSEMGNCCLDACPGIGEELQQDFGKHVETLSRDISPKRLMAIETRVREQLQDWGGRAATHNRERVAEVKEILIILANTAESVGARDERAAQQISDVTSQLKTIASLDDLSLIRSSIEKSAAELKTSIDRMAAEGKAAIVQLRIEVASFQAKLEEAESIASSDNLTGVRSRHSVEGHVEARMKTALPFCIAVVDIDGFKNVNDTYGHVVGDELLQLFATELKSRCRSTDIVGRWGGDEFIVLLDCGTSEAKVQSDRIRDWVCGNYPVHVKSGSTKVRVEASFGLAEYHQGETMKALFARADAAMYENKAASRATV